MNLRAFLVVAAAVVAVMLAASVWAWPQVPDDAQVPIHWGLDGQPDGFAPKAVGLLGMPAFALVLAAVLAIVPRVEPRRDNLARSASAYRTAVTAIVVVLGVVHLAAIAAATGWDVEIGGIVPVAVGAVLVVIGNVLGKTRSTFLFGIRTPWTLTSERSWARTHRLGGRLMVALGLAVVAATGLGLRGAPLFTLLGAGLAALVVVVFAYSYLVWRDDPDRRSLGGAR